MFFLIGPWLLDRLGPSRAIGIAAVLGAGRWLVSALTLDLTAIALIQPLHGVTFALLHLACMRLLAICVPPQLAATAQALYGTVGVGAATAILIVASGWLYSSLGAHAFLVMSGLCLAALPVAFSLIGPRCARQRIQASWTISGSSNSVDTRSLATVIGRRKRRGPALPGLRYRTPSRVSTNAWCEWPNTTAA